MRGEGLGVAIVLLAGALPGCAAGLPDVFMNILTSQGLMTRYATDWSGPEAVVKSIDLKLGAPNVPGMVMTMTGEVSARYTRG